MKKYHLVTNIISGIALCGLLGCNNDFMDRFPTDSISDENYWHSAKDLELYCNGLYTFIEGHSTGNNQSPLLTGDNQSDNMAPQRYNTVAAGEHVVPAKSSSSEWNWDFIRKCNYFLTRYQRTPIKESERDVYAAEVKFLKSWDYFNKVKRYGDVPWLSRDLATDSEELYAPRDSRILVMDSVLNTIDWAIEKRRPTTKPFRTGSIGMSLWR